MEPRLMGIVVVVLVVSAAGVFTIAMMRREATSVVLLQNSYPQKLINIEREGKHFTFAHGFLARRDIAELEIRFSYIHSSPEPMLIENQSGYDFRNYREVGVVESYLGEGSLLVDVFEAEIDGDPYGSKIHIFDLSRSFQPFSATASAGSVASVFGQEVSNGGNRSFLQGISDFFYDRRDNIEYLVVAHGTNETSYSSGRGPGPGISEAPKGGAVILRNLEKGDMVAIEFTVVPDRKHMPERTWNKNYARKIFEVMRVYADGELVLALANPIEVDLI